ncbi:Hypothetical predicted protein [Octopus vulgaris]|uniref:Uncharacterized protein n=1 Tax=Octopus vulgaris TaxID=6645 RepID=A0AA36AI45_OCTVU|nr:Hypothetical predicted protein [Octopus vulgaris]
MLTVTIAHSNQGASDNYECESTQRYHSLSTSANCDNDINGPTSSAPPSLAEPLFGPYDRCSDNSKGST